MIASTRGEPDGFTEFVRARGGSLHRTAMLLTHDHAAAEDLGQTALAKAWQNWHRADQPEAYVRRILVNEFASGWRRKWRGEVPTDERGAGGVDALRRSPAQPPPAGTASGASLTDLGTFPASSQTQAMVACADLLTTGTTFENTVALMSRDGEATTCYTEATSDPLIPNTPMLSAFDGRPCGPRTVPPVS